MGGECVREREREREREEGVRGRERERGGGGGGRGRDRQTDKRTKRHRKRQRGEGEMGKREREGEEREGGENVKLAKVRAFPCMSMHVRVCARVSACTFYVAAVYVQTCRDLSVSVTCSSQLCSASVFFYALKRPFEEVNPENR